MGQPKINLPWGATTVLGQVVQALHAGGVDEIIVVTGETLPQMDSAWQTLPLRLAHNPDPDRGDMLASLQAGLRLASPETQAILVTLGDQPQIQAGVVESLLIEFQRQSASLIVPSYQMRRGHPWLARRDCFPALLSLAPPATLRDFLNLHAERIHYLAVNTESILQDLDTPQDYESQRPPA
jgi:molybdenum cofactor cytidylyltransferase